MREWIGQDKRQNKFERGRERSVSKLVPLGLLSDSNAASSLMRVDVQWRNRLCLSPTGLCAPSGPNYTLRTTVCNTEAGKAVAGAPGGVEKQSGEAAALNPFSNPLRSPRSHREESGWWRSVNAKVGSKGKGGVASSWTSPLRTPRPIGLAPAYRAQF